MSQVKHHISGPEYWRSLEQLAQSPEVLERIAQEFPGYDPEEIARTSRRSFLKLMSASMALAGLTLSGCRRWPEEQVVAQSSNPTGRVPGSNRYFATMMELGGVAYGLLANSYDGRPIKIEGNALHPSSRVTELYGSADAFAQASVLELYDPDRSRGVVHRDGQSVRVSNLGEFLAAAPQMLGDGTGVAVLSEATSSPSVLEMRKRFMARFPQARWYEYEPISHDSEQQGTRQAFGQPLRPYLQLERAEVIVSLDADLLGTHPAHTRYANDWVKRRRSADQGAMSRVYVAESCYSITGSVADERLPLRPSRMLAIALALAAQVGVADVHVPGDLNADEQAFARAAAADLQQAGKGAVVSAGSHLPPEVHAVVMAINAQLGAVGSTVALLPVEDRPTHLESIRSLHQAMTGGNVQTLLILGGNPAYDAPADIDFAAAMSAVRHTVHLSVYRNETSMLANWHLPRAHYLESWGDGRSYDGTVTLQQPLIEPLFHGISVIELLAQFSGDEVKTGLEIVRRTIGGDEASFRRALHDGLLADSQYKAVAAPALQALNITPSTQLPDGFELRLQMDYGVYDGRFANNGWLQELPDPMTKLTWDNAALISAADAQQLGVGRGDMLRISAGGRTLEIVAFVLPGQPQGVIGLPLGYGRTAAGNVGSQLGFDTYRLRTSDAPYFVAGAQVEKLGKTYSLAITQEHHIIDEVGLAGKQRRVGEKGGSGYVVREATLEQYRNNPRAAHKPAHGDLSLQLFEPPHQFNEPHAWGMAVDMTACIGCNACVVACQSENNIPVVGKPQVQASREMHWIRIDRYFKGTADDPNPEVVFQPMLCVHCENAPCEQVCPVAATVHDTEGLNTMIYNRCIGTRYCSNNCPYKVRRFNYFDFHGNDPRGSRFPAPWLGMPDSEQRDTVDPIKAMVFNPDVTVRMRGVMEKCTYCTQRLASAKIQARNAYLSGQRESDIVQDGEVLTACQQACPTQAIVFGNLNDPQAAVTQQHRNSRAYSVLEELNTRPRTRHLALVRNPNQALRATPAPLPTEEPEHA